MTKNYSDADMVVFADFGAVNSDNVGELAVLLGKNVASVRAKAVRMGVYTSKTAEKTNVAVVRKAALVAEIAELAGMNENTAETLVNAKLEALTAVRDAFLANAA